MARMPLGCEKGENDRSLRHFGIGLTRSLLRSLGAPYTPNFCGAGSACEKALELEQRNQTSRIPPSVRVCQYAILDKIGNGCRRIPLSPGSYGFMGSHSLITPSGLYLI